MGSWSFKLVCLLESILKHPFLRRSFFQHLRLSSSPLLCCGNPFLIFFPSSSPFKTSLALRPALGVFSSQLCLRASSSAPLQNEPLTSCRFLFYHLLNSWRKYVLLSRLCCRVAPVEYLGGCVTALMRAVFSFVSYALYCTAWSGLCLFAFLTLSSLVI